ncbi:MAG: hypothetical protein EBS74_04595 [Flavobacteriia bacterium]|nr:hypothetical protein [Flavobacteriia bacterium]
MHVKQREPVHYGRPTKVLEQPELFNLRADVSEKYNLAEQYPGEVKQMLEKILSHLEDVGDARPDQLAARMPLE